jgi:outer membrane protein OmpA-like peptidoglycan-associated protein
VIIAIDTATAIDTSTPVIIETVTVISVPETVTIVSGIETVTIWMKEPFRVNSYFINVKAALELKKIATRYKNSNVLRITVLGYSSPSLINPYPSKLGIWRATAVQKVLKKNGLKTTYVAKYGGLYRGKRIDARRVVIQILIKK